MISDTPAFGEKRREELCSLVTLPLDEGGWKGVEKGQIFVDVLYEWPLKLTCIL